MRRPATEAELREHEHMLPVKSSGRRPAVGDRVEARRIGHAKRFFETIVTGVEEERFTVDAREIGFAALTMMYRLEGRDWRWPSAMVS